MLTRKQHESAFTTTTALNERTDWRCVGVSFVEHYRQTLEAGYLADPAQLDVAVRLGKLATQLVQFESSPKWRRLVDGIVGRTDTSHGPKGLYLWGGVGRGKTFLMDLFFDWLPIQRKTRLHFHHFMQLVHAQLHELEGRANPLREIARSFNEKTRLLCFDEFFVSDIGDAMILAELLDALFEAGLVFIATSNTMPSKLYENGLQHSRFVPAIALIEKHTDVVEIGGSHDYRLAALQRGEIYRLNYPVAERDIRADQLNLAHRALVSSNPLLINGRELRPLYHLEGIAGFAFRELCETPRNVPDYIELARIFHTIVLYDIRILNPDSESAARRFIALIDEFYDRNVNVIFHAEAPINLIYQGNQLTKVFERTISRVIEMQADSYLSAAHRA